MQKSAEILPTMWLRFPQPVVISYDSLMLIVRRLNYLWMNIFPLLLTLITTDYEHHPPV